ncbi:hypothetical protein [Haloarcula argentinensis]|uniref:Uncharacterized protein n=1 Tax=Haloarcula argentinensis TaxID=43776 RepID=A0ABU2EZ13_HALAR|nr:hypothetical protein [Haloarcula argentinensis]MDS0253238.1 hypothetical protein [Haloarcula argentinensis]
MTSPAEGWEDTERGYEQGDTSVTVGEVKLTQYRNGDRTEYNGYQVRVWIGKPGYASPEEIATYEEPRKAWELANILTHYLSAYNSKLDLSNITDGFESGEHLPPDGVAEREPEELLRDALGHHEFRLDEVLTDE